MVLKNNEIGRKVEATNDALKLLNSYHTKILKKYVSIAVSSIIDQTAILLR